MGTAADPDQPSYAAYCEDDAIVNGKMMNTCLGDLFSVSWMEDLDAHGSSQSLESQYQTVKKLVSKSSVKQWGDLSFKTDPLSEFFGNIKKTGAAVSPASVRSIR